ncbi:ABC transporter ATP-binding protein [bacterium]|nr:ABC transporter ATP-binding protein [bacterium]
MSVSWIEVNELKRHYQRGPQTVRALDGVSFEIDRGELVAVVGSSGSGKSTLLNLLAGLDTPTSGSIRVGERFLEKLTRRELALYRAHAHGMVFQSFHLINHRSALQNVELALYFSDLPARERKHRATAMLERLGLGDRLDHRPGDLSGGEQQRVAIARALVKEPEILFADEPTGNLDHDNAGQIASLLQELNRGGLTILLVTHDRELAERVGQRSIRLVYGKVESITSAGEVTA